MKGPVLEPLQVGKGRNPQRQLTIRQWKFVQGVIAGKSKKQAAIDAGYSRQYAHSKSHRLLELPLVQSVLTDALERQGITPDRIVKSIVDGLKATRRIQIPGQAKLFDTGLPDFDAQFKAHDRAVALYGGIPKKTTASPTASGVTINIHKES